MKDEPKLSAEEKVLQFKYNTEMKLRGSMLVTAVTLEVILITIVYYSNADQWEKADKSPSLKLKNLTFDKKIKRVMELLFEHHPDLLTKYDALFIDLVEFKDIRNKIAHCAINWMDERCERLQILDVVAEPNKLNFYFPEEHNYIDLAASISELFSKISPSLALLENEVESRLRQNHPVLYSIISSPS
jgi:hypothetical protein